MDLSKVLRSYSDFQKLESTAYFQRLQSKLKEDRWYKPVLDTTEEASKINRVYIVTGCGSILLTTLLYHFGIQLICGAVGFLYPGYQTVECLKKFDQHEWQRWLTYWLVVSAFNFLEILLFFLHWLPGYWIIKCAFYVWCYAPFPNNGSEVIFSLLIQPFLEKNQEVIGEAIHQFARTVHTICNDPRLDGACSQRSHSD